MNFPISFIPKILRENGGSLWGRTRLQKTLYFLERLQLGCGFSFSYHHYGPYSEDAAAALNYAVALEIVAEEKESSLKGVISKYVVVESVISNLDRDERQDEEASRKHVLQILGRYDAITLELAATADFLREAGFGTEGMWQETKVRKASKATDEKIKKAQQLLEELSSFH